MMIWSKTDLKLLKKVYPFETREKIEELFSERSWQSIQRKAERENIKRPLSPWNETDIKNLKILYPISNKTDLMNIFSPRTYNAIKCKALSLGLKKQKNITTENIMLKVNKF